MSGGSARAIVELDGDYLSAIEVVPRRGGWRVPRATVQKRPAGVDGANAEALGRWMRQALEEGRIPTKGVVIALPRRDAVLKRIGLPATMSREDPDLPGMVRLQALRQSSVAGENPVVDYVFLEGAGGSPPAVLAGVMGGARVDLLKQAAERGGLGLRAITLRSFGAGPVVPREADSTLVVALGPGSVEFTLVEDGSVSFSRTAELPRPEEGGDIEGFALKVGVEAKRTWMSHRLSLDGARLARVIVLGNDEVCVKAAERTASALETPTEALDPVRIATWGAQGGAGGTRASELAGLAGLAMLGREQMLDFANPHQPADRFARARQGVLLGVLGLIVLGGAGWLAAQQALSHLKTQVAAANEREKELSAQYLKFLLEKGRLAHLKAWQSAKPDWVSHLAWLSTHLPEPREALLSSVGGSLDQTLAFTPGEGGDAMNGTWALPPRLRLSIDGAGGAPAMVDFVREKLIKAGGYVVRADGPDAGRQFSIDLDTARLSPAEVKP
jgi:hypothetical protein